MDRFEFFPQMLILAFILLKGKKVSTYFGPSFFVFWCTDQKVCPCLFKNAMPYLFVAFEIGMNVKNVYGVLVFTTSK